MNILDKMFNFGSTFRLLFFISSVIVLVIFLIRNPGQKPVVWAFIFIGVIGTVREYRQWRNNR